MTSITAIIPALNAAERLPKCIASLGDVAQVLVIDGESSDATVGVADGCGATVVRARRGRGGQMIAGAALATSDWLLFLHADTVLETGWRREVEAFVTSPANRMRAAVFQFVLDDASPQARRLETQVALRTRMFALPYGDQGLFISRAFYDALGGFRDIPIMEDVDIVHRIGRRRLACLEARAITSAARWRQRGWLRRSARNLGCLALYFAGVPPRHIVKVYG